MRIINKDPNKRLIEVYRKLPDSLLDEIINKAELYDNLSFSVTLIY